MAKTKKKKGNFMHKKRYATWLRLADSETRAELQKMTEEQIEDAFFDELTFQTAGIRGEMGVGSNRLNSYTIKKITKGVAGYLKSKDIDSVVISYDNRNNSQAFSQLASQVFAKCKIKVYLTKELMPTPFLSYAVKKLGVGAGVMITASHNPSLYNGYKVYDGEGCQVDEESATEISGFIQKANPFRLTTESFEHYKKKGDINFVAESVEKSYLNEVLGVVCGSAEGVRVVYTPLNGTGYRIVPKILKRLNAEVFCTPLQSEVDGNFPTCPYPNPEKKEALSLSLEYARTVNADLVIATDPDADRMAMAVKEGEDYVLFSGNETGVIFADYLLKKRGEILSLKEIERGINEKFKVDDYDEKLAYQINETTNKKENCSLPVIIKSIVTTDLINEVAKSYGGETREVLTGFKNIGKEIKVLKKDKSGDFVLGLEESCGYLAGDYARDKDGVFATALATVICAEYKKIGLSMVERLNQIYNQFGHYRHKTLSFTFFGASGNKKRKKIMEKLRLFPLKTVCGKELQMTDYKTEGERLFADLLELRGDNLKLIVRPSGTEPLIKVYISLKEKEPAILNEIEDFISQKIKSLELES